MPTPQYTQLPLEIEIWNSIPEYVGLYEASNQGHVRRIKGFRSRETHILTPALNTHGYLSVGLCNNGVSHRITVASIIAKVFIGMRPDNYDINHKDGNKLNNHVDNLEYITRQENIQHSYASGLQIAVRGYQHGNVSLNPEQMQLILLLLEEKQLTQKEIAAQVLTSEMTISRIKNKKHWSSQ